MSKIISEVGLFPLICLALWVNFMGLFLLSQIVEWFSRKKSKK